MNINRQFIMKRSKRGIPNLVSIVSVCCIIIFTLTVLTYIPSAASTTVADPKVKLLEKMRTKDPIVSSAANQVRKILPSVASNHVEKSVEFYILDYTENCETLPYKNLCTNNCKALIRGFETPIIICNADLFYEIEAAIRSFLISQQQIPNDEKLFKLVPEIQSDTKGYLTRIRKLYGNFRSTSSLDNQVVAQMKVVMLFLIGHEIGHIKDAGEGRSFINRLNPDAPLEKRVANAVVRMCRHVEEFNELGYDLPGWKDAADLKSRVRKAELQLREKEELMVYYENTSQWYQDEVSADKIAAAIILHYLNGLKKIDALEAEHFFISNLFFMSVYYLYKDIYNFSIKACGKPMENSSELMICMMKSRDQYIKAASLFGDVHMFFLLRSILAIEKILEQRTDFFRTDKCENTIWISKEEFEKLDKNEQMTTFWYYSNLQKYVLLSIIMDTPIKFAYVGCSTGWFKEIDKQRGTPQLLFLTFETIDQAIQRLLKFR